MPAPKLLVATEFPPNASGGGPAVVRQMLKDWPVDRLAWWSCLPERDQRFRMETAAHRVARIPAKLYPQNRMILPKSWLLENVWARWAARHLRAAIREVRPDVIWVIPHNWAVLPLASVLPAARVGFHVTVQDFVDVGGNIPRFGTERCQRLARAAEKLYATATTRDATSHPMIADLQERTSCEASQMLHAGLEPEDFAFLETKQSAPRSAIRIAHAGTIVVEEVFARFVAALRRVKAAQPRRIEMHLFGAHSYAARPWFDAEWIIEHGNLAEPELSQRLRDCDWGFSPMALTDGNPRYNRFSFPTKFITCLAAGLPLITLGHPGCSVMKMARAYDIGVCCDATSEDGLEQRLSDALSEPDPWARFRGEIVRCARTEFDAARMRRILFECFERCARTTGELSARP